MNQVRIRDVIAEDPNTFEIHRLERTAVGMKEAEDEPVTRIECASEEEKIEWVSTINVEVKDLKFFAKRLSREFSSSESSLITV